MFDLLHLHSVLTPPSPESAPEAEEGVRSQRCIRWNLRKGGYKLQHTQLGQDISAILGLQWIHHTEIVEWIWRYVSRIHLQMKVHILQKKKNYYVAPWLDRRVPSEKQGKCAYFSHTKLAK